MIFGIIANSQDKENFFLLDENYEADFNYQQFDSINNYIGVQSLLKNVFNPTIGEYTIMRYIRKTPGNQKNGEVSENHELILLKVCPKTNMIVQFVYFPLDWKEMPLSAFIVIRDVNVKFRKKLEIVKFNLGPEIELSGFLFY